MTLDGSKPGSVAAPRSSARAKSAAAASNTIEPRAARRSAVRDGLRRVAPVRPSRIDADGCGTRRGAPGRCRRSARRQRHGDVKTTPRGVGREFERQRRVARQRQAFERRRARPCDRARRRGCRARTAPAFRSAVAMISRPRPAPSAARRLSSRRRDIARAASSDDALAPRSAAPGSRRPSARR